MSDETLGFIGQIIGLSLASFLVVGLIVSCVLAVIWSVRIERLRSKFIESLDDHDKSVILAYKSINGFKK